MMAEAPGSEDEYGTAPRSPWSSTSRPVPRSCKPSRATFSENDDLADLYEDASVAFLGFADDAAYVEDPLRQGTTGFPLHGGKPEAVPTDDFGIADLPAFAGERGVEVTVRPTGWGGYAVSETGDGYSGVLSPDERYVFVDGDGNGGRVLRRRQRRGTPVRPGSAHLSGSAAGSTTRRSTARPAAGAVPSSRPDGCASCRARRWPGTCSPVSPGFRLPPEPSLLFDTGVGPYFY